MIAGRPYLSTIDELTYAAAAAVASSSDPSTILTNQDLPPELASLGFQSSSQIYNNNESSSTSGNTSAGVQNRTAIYDSQPIVLNTLTGRKFQCPRCHKEFQDRSTFRHHYMTHTGERPHQCFFCPYRSIQSGSLYRHIRMRHKGVLQ